MLETLSCSCRQDGWHSAGKQQVVLIETSQLAACTAELGLAFTAASQQLLPACLCARSQLEGLPELRSLVLERSCLSADDYGVLERLPRLRSLLLRNEDNLPACLPLLTGLEDLAVQFGHWNRPEYRASLDAALQSLTGLTSL